MKCQFCNGLGYVFVNDFNGQFDMICPKCKGKKELDENENPIMTNEEWFCSLSTEEKAKTIVCLEVNALHKWKKGLVESDVDEIKRWLKQPHTVKE